MPGLADGLIAPLWLTTSLSGVRAVVVPLTRCGPCGQDMPADHECPVLGKRLRRHLRAVADQIHPEGRTATPGATGAAAKSTREETRAMANPTEITRRPWETKPGDVIVRHPDRHDQTGEWTITSECGNDGWFCWLDYRTADGAVGRFVFKPGQMATLRSGATYVVEALLTDDERDAAFHDLSEDDCGHIAAHVRDQFPEIFDAALAAFGRYKAGLPAGPSAVTEAGA